MLAVENASRMGPGRPPRWLARLSLQFSRENDRTILSKSHEGPLMVQRALYPEGRRICHAIVLHPPGGIATGDLLDLRLDLQGGSHAVVTSPGMSRWYRSEGDEAEQRVTAVVDGGVLEWLPPGGILFDGAEARMHTAIDLQRGGRFVGWDLIVFGRSASGERFSRGTIRRRTTIRQDGALLFDERTSLRAGDPLFSSPVGLRGAGVSATFVAAGPDPDGAIVDGCRRIHPGEEGAAAGVSALPGLLIGQYLGASSERARRWLEAVWQVVRPAYAGLAAAPPRIWST